MADLEAELIKRLRKMSLEERQAESAKRRDKELEEEAKRDLEGPPENRQMFRRKHNKQSKKTIDKVEPEPPKTIENLRKLIQISLANNKVLKK